jgi:hypothetical protein
MKLLGRKNEKFVVASIAHYDCRFSDDLMMDGGQPHCSDYSGYNRFGGKGDRVWFEVPQNFADLYNDYQFNSTRSGVLRKYGVWKVEDVRIINDDEIPDLGSDEVIFENIVWGTRGKDGKQPLKYVLLKDCDKEHLKAILENQNVGETMEKALKYWIDKK